VEVKATLFDTILVTVTVAAGSPIITVAGTSPDWLIVVVKATLLDTILVTVTVAEGSPMITVAGSLPD
jgi:hypothetical protein